MEQINDKIRRAAEYIKEKTGGIDLQIGIVLGSGLGKLAEKIEDALVIPYGEIPDFPVSTAIGHAGNFIFGKMGGKNVVAMQGRFHFYEGYPIEIVTLPIRVMSMLGIKFLFVSNAAGACNIDYRVGDLVIIKDHISNIPNPLIGPNMEDFGPRFPDMTCAYDLDLISRAENICIQMGIDPKKGVYLANTGPTYETPAEVRFYRTIGADLLGMSTVPEVVVARHCGIKVFGMSVVTNEANTRNTVRNLNDGEDVVKQANVAADKMSELFARMISEL